MPAKIFGDMSLESPTSHDAASAFPSLPQELSSHHILGTPTLPPAPATAAAAGRTADVVVTGMSGRLPESDNLDEFRDNLMGGVDMVTEDGRRWTPGLHNLPKRGGKLKDISKFDATFFGVHGKQANAMDPQLRLLLEVTYEALVDAGVSPGSVRGSRTGVFVGCSASEAQDAWTGDLEQLAGYEMTGCTRSMFANRLSFFFDFKGPSYAIDTACSSSLLALHQALQAIRNDECEAAIVAGCNLCLKPATTLQFQKLSMLSPEGACKSFDASGNGYVRSEAVVAVYLQRAPLAKRIYATLVHSKTNTDGNKSQGITFPSGAVQKQLLEETYRESGIDPASVTYIEAHGTGTKVGDPQEVNTIADVFCRKARQGPLLIGSTKSNMGHPEPASGLAALVKVLIAMEEKQLPPNLHFKTANPDIPALVDGRLQVVTKRTPWNGGCVAINSFGFGGANVHVVLKSFEAEADEMEHPAAKVPRLLTVSGRTDAAVESMLAAMAQRSENVAAQALLQETSTTPAQSHPYRGYCILNSNTNNPASAAAAAAASTQKDIEALPSARAPVWFVFAGMGTQWHGMGRALMPLPVFRASIQRSDAALAPYGVALVDLLMTAPADALEDTMHSFVGIAAIQVALVDVMRSLHISPDGIVGHSVGELGCAYADGGLTAEETVLAAYWRGRCVKEANLPPGGMAAVGMTWEQAKARCPEGVVPACHNSLDTITISGPLDAVHAFVLELKSEGVFAKEVNSAGVAFHSYYMAKTAPALKKALARVIPSPRPRTERWVSSSIPKAMWDSELARYSSADYHVNNLLSPVLFQEALENVPRNAVVIEFAPHCLLQAILKRSLGGDCTFVGLMKRNHPDNMDFFLASMGKLHNAGVDFNPLLLHSTSSSSSSSSSGTSVSGTVLFPVPRGTPMLGALVRWDHGTSWSVPTLEQVMGGAGGAGAGCVYEVDIGQESPEHYLVGHRIDGRVLYPATGYMVLAWRTLAKLHGHVWTDMAVCLEDVSIHRATIMPLQGKVKFEVTVSPGNGHFEVCESDSLVASGRIYQPEVPHQVPAEDIIRPQGDSTQGTTPQEASERLMRRDVYKELRLRGYDYGPTFQGIVSAHGQGEEGYLSWADNWVSFLDAMMQIQILSSPGSTLRLPTRIKSMRINPAQHATATCDLDAETKAVKALVDTDLSTVYAGGVELLGLHTTVAPRRPNAQAAPVLEEYAFVPYAETDLRSDDAALTAYMHKCEATAQRMVECAGLGDGLSECRALFSNGKEQGAGEEEEEEEQDEVKGGKCTLLKLLQEVGQLESAQDAKEMIEANKDLQDDCLLSALINSPSFKCCVDVVRENLPGSRIKVTEVSAEKGRLFKQIVPKLLSEPQLQLEYVAAAASTTAPLDQSLLEELGVTEARWDWSDSPSAAVANSHLVIANNVLHARPSLSDAIAQLRSLVQSDNGYLLVKEVTSHLAIPAVLDRLTSSTTPAAAAVSDARTCGPFCDASVWRAVLAANGLSVIAEKSDGLLSTMFLCKVITDAPAAAATKVICCDSLSYEWVEELKEAVASPDVHRLWLVASDLNTGLVGMVNCLKQEPGGEKIRCVVGACAAALTEEVRTRDLVINVYGADGKWGSFRHMPLGEGVPMKTSEHAYVNVLTRGDLSSLAWIESSMKYHDPASHPDESLCKVCYTALNFRDVMLATGKLPPDAIPGDLASQDCLLGMEVAGRERGTGRRVMGLLSAKGLASSVSVNKRFLWDVPEAWSLEEAATVPVVYATAYYALVVRGRIRRGDSVLIHSGSGGVGQAAIAVALHAGCRVFTTVGSVAKRDYLRRRFPELAATSPDCFANSRSAADFERHVLKATHGRGVDVVLNSLAADALTASLRCLAQHGRFLEIGKVDLANNSALGMSVFLRNITFHGILLDALFDGASSEWDAVAALVSRGIHDGAVRPLQSTCFPADRVEDAFRFMAQGKHIGKVVIQVANEDEASTATPATTLTTTTTTLLPCLPRLWCDPRRAYIVTGGLGGFGLELAGWLAERGARRLVLTSRRAHQRPRSAFQARRLRALRAAGVAVTVSARDVGASEAEAHALVEESRRSPGGGGVMEIGGVFHLAMVLQDGFLENQSAETFGRVGAAKVAGTLHMDKAMRTCCCQGAGEEQVQPWFVVFSSVSCGRGNAGQSSYGFANSYMERLVEQRHRDGLHGLAIQWGAIGDVGVVQDSMGGDNDTVIGGTLPQRIASCLTTLDRCLNQPLQPVLSSYVLADKKVKSSAEGGGGKSLSESVAHILGLKDVASINPAVSLGDLGLDSLMGTEVKQCLERADIVLPISEVRALTFARLAELQGGGSGGGSGGGKGGGGGNGGGQAEVKPGSPKKNASHEVNDEALNRYDLNEMIPTQTLVPLNDRASSAGGGGGDSSNPPKATMILVHPIEGSVKALRAVAQELQSGSAAVYGLQCTDAVPTASVADVAAHYIKEIHRSNLPGPYHLVGYSFGACIAFEMALQLQEDDNKQQQLSLLDGSHAYVAAHTERRRSGAVAEDETAALCAFVLQFCSALDSTVLHARLLAQTTFADRLAITDEILRATKRFPGCDIVRAAEGFYKKLIIAAEYQPTAKLRTDVTLIKAENATHEAGELGEDYGLKAVVDGKIRVFSVAGDHTSFLQAGNAKKVAAILDGKQLLS